MKFDEKVAMVTGAGSGIGRATALAFVRERARVTLVDNDRDAGEDAVDAGEDAVREVVASGGEAIFVLADVSSEQDVSRAVDETATAFGGLDILHNNAGVTALGNATELAVDDWNRIIATNLTGAFLCARIAIPQMKKRGGGSILSMSFIGSMLAVPHYHVMGPAKASLEASSRYLAKEVGPDNIRVNVISPGAIRTLSSAGIKDFAELMRVAGEHSAMKRTATQAEVALTAVFLASEASSGITGQVIYVDCGYSIMDKLKRSYNEQFI